MLGRLAPFFCRSARSAGMRAHYRAVYQQILHIRLFNEMQIHPLPDAPDDTLYIFDRHYLSELVYAPIDSRGATLPYNPFY